MGGSKVAFLFSLHLNYFLNKKENNLKCCGYIENTFTLKQVVTLHYNIVVSAVEKHCFTELARDAIATRLQD